MALARCAQTFPAVGEDAYRFYGSVPQAVLAGYLERSIALPGLWREHPAVHGEPSCYLDDLRTLVKLGAKHVGFACDAAWENTAPCSAELVLVTAGLVAADLHRIDPDMIVGATCLESVGPAAGSVRIPAWVFEEWKLPYEERNFRWARMVGSGKDEGGAHAIVHAADITLAETRMWYYFWARSYIDLGIEHLHFGQLDSLTRNDRPACAHYRDLLARVRAYAARNARRATVLISVHQAAPPAGEWRHA